MKEESTDALDFQLSQPLTPLPFDGERYTTALGGTIEQEHIHRYLFAASYCKGKDVLDVACGEGYGSAVLSTYAKSVVGVDISSDAVQHANCFYRRPRLNYVQGTCQDLPVKAKSVDVVVSFETIEHIGEHGTFLANIRGALRPGGLLIMSTPDRIVYSSENGVANPYHVKELSNSELQSLLASSFEHVEMLGQKSTSSSIIAPLSGSDTRPVQIVHRRLRMAYTSAPYISGAPFLIALASDSPIATPPMSVLDDPNLISNLLQVVIPRLEARIVELGEVALQRKAEGTPSIDCSEY